MFEQEYLHLLSYALDQYQLLELPMVLYQRTSANKKLKCN